MRAADNSIDRSCRHLPLIRRLSVAPMLDWTDRYCRYFHRLLTRRTLLYTEMVTTGALLHNDPARFLDFFAPEHPLALQLGGSHPENLAACSRLAEEWGYDEVNLNLGCPSDRVQSGMFGACLMARPDQVAECISAMTESCTLPITAKHRIGIDELDSYDLLTAFVEKLANAGCKTFIVHARKAWLQGLSPRENRDVPPLHYDRVYRLKQDFPHLEIILNGGVKSLDEALGHLEQVDGVMIGREAYQNPWMLAEVDRRIYGDDRQPASRHQVIEQLLPLVEQECSKAVPLKRITRHILGLFHGQPGAKKWRRYLSENAHLPGAGPETLETALGLVPRIDD
ncbi:tRNA dihydrouridine(20/20a) synthase DusA [Thiolapillus brandeum]|uniref:tRNA-dihydrouridine(20/20a) synthase n=1 Tax=Thiolapillus brandeum TaxID=1076588 RepID=A0A7U6GK14_9GAMM|nr:tRNA dihydrouridine(20/20a) synthase DusA [Thiolapillus brandeum]BAO45107.1 tRNA-dihydrouridine synthase A [Thiolapillus brandeum]